MWSGPQHDLDDPDNDAKGRALLPWQKGKLVTQNVVTGQHVAARGF